MRYVFGDVVLVPFPFTDQSTTKQRPAVVISGDRYNARRPDATLLAITSQVRTTSAFGDALLSDWQAAGLIKPSLLKPVVTTIEQNLIRKSLGKLSAVDISTLRGVIGNIIG